MEESGGDWNFVDKDENAEPFFERDLKFGAAQIPDGPPN